MIRLAENQPPYCVVCFNQQPQKRHIDFDAMTDRGWTDIAGNKVSLDNIIVCEDCVRNGAEQIGMTDNETLKRRLKQKEAESERYKREAIKAQEYADRLEEMFDNRPTKIRIDHRIKPRERVDA